jgi:hypothetical protein
LKRAKIPPKNKKLFWARMAVLEWKAFLQEEKSSIEKGYKTFFGSLGEI